MTLVLLAGQSNALGFGNNGPAPFAPSDRVQIWSGGSFEPMIPGWNTGTAANPAAWGPEVEFANRWLAEHAGDAETLYLGKVVKGSTGLAQADGLDWNPASHGELFDQATAVAQAMQRQLGVHQLDGVLWMQGETDATDPASAAGYHDHLAELADVAHSAWGAPGLVVGRIGEAGAYSADVRYAQWLVDQERADVVSFKTIGLGLQADGLHYDAAGQISLGDGFFDAWATL